MNGGVARTVATILLVVVFARCVDGHTGPFDGADFKGRIAFSSDGNFNDEDDWGALPIAIAILDAFGVADRLVHVDYCNIVSQNDPRFYGEMVESVEGAARRYDIPRSILFDCQEDLDGVIESIADAINASSADSPLYYVLAGPMQVPFLGIEKSDPRKRKYVYCISHSVWNDGYTRADSSLHLHNKRDVIPSGINWIQCRDGNRNLAHPGGPGKQSTRQQWSLYSWLRDSSDLRLKWIYSRLQAEKRCDISDSTMTYFLLTGDEDADLQKFDRLLSDKEKPLLAGPRKTVRIEAENFRDIGRFKVVYGDRRASHRVCLAKRTSGTDRIGTTFNDIYIADGGYDIEIRYRDAGDGCSYRLSIKDDQVGGWRASATDGAWRSHIISNVIIDVGDEIRIDVRSESEGGGELDYIQLNRTGSH